MSLNLLAVF